MPYPYIAIPSLSVWLSDSTFAFTFLRSSDKTMIQIDGYVEAYHEPTLATVQRETLFYLRLALKHWLQKLNATPKNTAPTGMNVTNLPTTAKVSGSEKRIPAAMALLDIVNSELRTLHAKVSDMALTGELKTIYGVDNHGQVGDNLILLNNNVTKVFLTTEGLQRQYKLRFRSGVAWRWNHGQGCYTIFDSTNNVESETNDQMVHFVMTQNGRIFAGFDKTVDWFKHSSLVGGANAFAAGRMKVVNGVVTFVENDSGHFQPGHRQMLNLLHRLKLYGADISQTKVRRHNDKAIFKSAQMLASPSGWPA